MATLVLEFQKTEKDDETKYITFYLNSNAEKIIKEYDINDVFESIMYLNRCIWNDILNVDYYDYI